MIQLESIDSTINNESISLSLFHCRLNSRPKDEGESALILEAPPNSVLGQILAKNMDAKSFAKQEDSIQRTLRETKHAFFDSTDIMKVNQDRCKLKLVFTFKGNAFGLAFSKGWPFAKFLSRELLKLQSSGRYQLIAMKQRLQDPDCAKNQEPDYGSISVKKVIMLFLLICLGVFLALLICLMELCFKKHN